MQIDGASVSARSGAAVRLPLLNTIHNTLAVDHNDMVLEASGTGSLLDLSGVRLVTNGTSGTEGYDADIC